jgi:preprotein translocase subunit SecG
MTTVLLILHLMIASALIGGGGGFMTGRGAANFLTRVTAGLAAAFFVTSMALTLLATRPAGPGSIFDRPASTSDKKQPADKAAPGQPPASGGVLDKLGPPAPSGPQVPRSQ